MAFSTQIPLTTGSHSVICDCGNTIKVRVSGKRKDIKGSYRQYHAYCPKCKVIYTGIKRTTNY